MKENINLSEKQQELLMDILMEKLSDIDHFMRIQIRYRREEEKDIFIKHIQSQKDKVIELYDYFFNKFNLKIRERKMIQKINESIKSMHKSLYEQKG